MPKTALLTEDHQSGTPYLVKLNLLGL